MSLVRLRLFIYQSGFAASCPADGTRNREEWLLGNQSRKARPTKARLKNYKRNVSHCSGPRDEFESQEKVTRNAPHGIQAVKWWALKLRSLAAVD